MWRYRPHRRLGIFVAMVGVAVTVGAAAGQVKLTDWTVQAGLTATHQPVEAGFPGLQEWMTGGLGVGDFNNDGWMDVFWISGGTTPDRLFINDGDGTFTDQSRAWGLGDLHCGNGVAVGDYNGDGNLDIYVTSFGDPGSGGTPGSHRLYRNNGNGTFTNVAEAAGVSYSSLTNPAGYGAAFGDYDLDGDLDLFVTSWWGNDEGNRLYRNNGDGTFDDVTVPALGDAIDNVWGFQPAFVDMNGDRYPELLIAADFETSRYFVNNGDGTFTDQTGGSGTGLDENGMGQTVGDFDNDGRLDWYVTSIHSETPPPDNPGNMLYMSQGDHLFLESSIAAGVNDGGWGWGTVAVDLDHDTWLDILEVNGRPAKGSEWINERGKLFHNQGGAMFTEIACDAGFDHTGEGRGLVYLDADNDGDLDILVATNAGDLTYYLNETLNPGNWLRLSLDTGPNPLLAPDGFGARVVVTVGGASYQRFVSGSPSYLATSELAVHFGLGAAGVVDELRVEWAKGPSTVLSNVGVNQHLTITAPPLGDVDGDGAVNVLDLIDLLLAWGTCPAPCPPTCPVDINGDCAINVLDLITLLLNFGS